MASEIVTLDIKFPWWAWPYINTCIFFAWLTGLMPDTYKIMARIARHTRTVVVSPSRRQAGGRSKP